MTETDIPRSGVFYPDEVEQMARELRRGDRPGEAGAEREERARDIVDRRDTLRQTGAEGAAREE